MTPLLQVKSPWYELFTEVTRSTILVDMPDGGKARIVHRSIMVKFVHRKTKDILVIKMTGKGKYFWNNLKKEVDESEIKETFDRLVGADGFLAFKVCQYRMFEGY